ncbi:MAG: hypothetical protein Fur0040_04920 [Sideroxydans sp.]
MGWLLGALWLAGCAALLPKDYLITQAQLERQLQRSFPLNRDLGRGFFRAMLTDPELGFDAERNRIAFATRFSAGTLMRSGLDGRIAVSGGLRYDAAQRAIFVQDMSVDSLQLKQDTSGVADMLRGPLTVVLNEYLKDHPLYQFEPEQLRFGGREIPIEALQVTSNGIRVNFKK